MKLRVRPSRAALWSSAVLFAVGVAVLAIASWMVAGWHDIVPDEPPSWLARIQYDSAWAFAFAGVSLLAAAARLRAFAALCAAIPIALGTLRLVAYLAPAALSIHPILANPWLPYGAGNYSDMGV